MLSSPCEVVDLTDEANASQNQIEESTAVSNGSHNMTRRALIATIAALGVCGATAAVLGGLLFPGLSASRAYDITYDPAEDENLVLSEASTVRPKRAVPQGELATIDLGTDDSLPSGASGTIRLRVTGAWLYETKDAFERVEGVDVESNYADKVRIEEGEKQRAYDEKHPDEAEAARVQRQELIAKTEAEKPQANSKPKDLLEEFNRRSVLGYAEDGTCVYYAITTQLLLDSGYKLLTYDLEIENVDAVSRDNGTGASSDLLSLPSLARGCDWANYEICYYLAEGEDGPTSETLKEAGDWTLVSVPQGKKRAIHVVMAVSPRSLKGELSLFMGLPVFQSIPDSVVFLALEPDLVAQ